MTPELHKYFNGVNYTKSDEYNFLKELSENTLAFADNYKEKGSRQWGKIQGLITATLLKKFIDNKLQATGSQFATSESNCFINGFPYEFDLFILNKNATNEFPNIYNPNDVKTIIEIKTSGIIGSKEQVCDTLERLKGDFENVKQKFPSINFVYITIFERGKPKREGSLNYIKTTLEGIIPYQAYFLFDIAKWEVNEGELSRFYTEIIK